MLLFFKFTNMIKANNIHKYYGELHVLKGVHLEVKKGEIVSIVAASGACKTTLLQILGTLLPASSKKKFNLSANIYSAGVRAEGMTYSKFINGLSKCGVAIDR